METTDIKGKKKVLIFVPKFPVLTETFIEREISKLSERGVVDVAVVSLKKSNGYVSPELENKVFYKRLSVLEFLLAVPFVVRHLDKIVSSFNLLQSSEKTLIGKVFLVLKAVGYSYIFSKFKPDLIIGHFMSTPSTFVMISSHILNIPFGISAHAKDITVESEFVKEKVLNAKFVLICNKNAYQHVKNVCSGINTQNIYLRYHGLDFDDLVSRDYKKPFELDVPVILNIGRLTEKKGQIYLIEASKILKEKGIKHKVFIIGPGPLYNELIAKIEDLGLKDTVSILGEGKGLSNEDTLAYLKYSDIFVFPAIKTETGDVDGLANVLVEAAALNIPIVSTDAGSSLDLLENEVSALIVHQKDSQKISISIENLLNDKSLVSSLTLNAHEKAFEIFDINKNVSEIEKLILE